MSVLYRNSMKYKLLKRINALPGNVILREDVADLGDRRQVSRALNKLISDEILIKISFGVYAKTKKAEISGKALLDFFPNPILVSASNVMELLF